MGAFQTRRTNGLIGLGRWLGLQIADQWILHKSNYDAASQTMKEIHCVQKDGAPVKSSPNNVAEEDCQEIPVKEREEAVLPRKIIFGSLLKP